jgi:tetratricopeptide (TPR) repeat protein
MGKNDVALADFGRAITANPNHAPAYLGRANLLRAQGNLQEAMGDLDQAIRLNNDVEFISRQSSASEYGSEAKPLIIVHEKNGTRL